MKLTGWERKLSLYVVECASKPFEWGVLDCALFVCGAIEIQIGKDVAAEFRGKYSDAVGAYRVIREFCGGGLLRLAKTIAKREGFELLESPLMAKPGDAAAFKVGKRTALGVVADRAVVYAMAAEGIARVRLSDCTHAWRIECRK